MGLFKKETPERMKLKELTGGFLISDEFSVKLKENNLKTEDGVKIQRLLKIEIEQGKLKVDDIEPRLQYLLKNQIKAQDVQEIIDKEMKKIRELEDHERKRKKELKEQERKRIKELEDLERKRVQTLSKEEKLRERIRKGVQCKIPKQVIANNGHDGLTKGVATLAFGITGWALTSGSQTKAQTVDVDATIKIVPNGIVISSKYEETMRIPFDQILNAEITGGWIFKNFEIRIVGSKTIYIRDCDYGETIVNSINKSATGVEEKGWV